MFRINMASKFPRVIGMLPAFCVLVSQVSFFNVYV